MISVAIFMYFFSLSLEYFSESKKEISEISEIRDTVEKIVNDPRCLGLDKKVLINSLSKTGDFSAFPLIDIKKVNSISKNFKDMLPYNCSFFEGGYRIKIYQYPFHLKSQKAENIGNSVWEELFPILNKHNVTFVVDFSGSMRGLAGTCDNSEYGGGKNTKLCCQNKFLIEFVKNFDVGTNISIIEFGDCGYGSYSGCCAGILLPKTTILNTNRDRIVDEIKSKGKAIGATPLRAGLKLANDHISDWGTNYIVLMTDGCENQCTNLPLASSVTTYTIGFGRGACMGPLNRLSSNTGGESYKAETCEELVSMKTYEPISLNIQGNLFQIGRKYLSSDFGSSGFTFSYPAMIYYNSTLILPGNITIEYSDDWLEKFMNLVEKSCLINKSLSDKIDIPYKISIKYDSNLNKNIVCIHYISKEYCQPLVCEKKVIEKTYSPGSYIVYTNISGDKIELL